MRYAGTRRSETELLRCLPLSEAAMAKCMRENVCQPVSPDGAIGHVHPDAALMILCGELRVLQEEWQRLWEATPETGKPGPADEAWEDFAEHVWPGCRRPDGDCERDLVRNLIVMQATTREGLSVKAAAVKAIDDACGYSMRCRDDTTELMLSVVKDAAGTAAMSLGES